MKKFLSTFFIGAWVVTCLQAEAAGRGRPGGGGGGVGGGFRPRPNPGPSQPIARPNPRPAPGPKPNPGPHPQPGPRPKPGNGAGPGPIRPRPGGPNVPGGKPNAGEIGKHLGGNPAGHFPGNPGHRPPYGGYHKTELNQNIYRHFPYHPNLGYPYGRDWCVHNNWHYTRWPYWAGAATGVALAGWIGVGNYSGYGSSEQVPYYPVEPAPPEVYQQSVAAPTEAVEQGQAAKVGEDSDWLSIGTFGIVPYKATDLAYAVQLASTKDGVVRGLQWDMKTDKTVEVEGSIQKDSLRVAWRAKDSELTFETNVDELSQQESLVNVYNNKTKSLVSWQLIQIDEKDLPPKP